MHDFGYLQHGKAGEPMRTEKVIIKNTYADNWYASYCGKWRKVHMNLSNLWIVYHGQKITIQIEGV